MPGTYEPRHKVEAPDIGESRAVRPYGEEGQHAGDRHVRDDDRSPCKCVVSGGILGRQETDGARTIMWFEELRGRLVVARPWGILRVTLAVVSRARA